MHHRQNGFTLIEIAIVLVIIGLILGGILKGQALIDSARVRSMASDISGIRTAWLAFQDRYNGLPGDFANASTQIDSALNNGNGKIDTKGEIAGVWQHLAKAGFISGDYDGSADGIDSIAGAACRAATYPANPFNGFYKIAFGEQIPGDHSSTHEFFTGEQIPVNILLQLDLKLDDGLANSGAIQSHAATDNNCRSDQSWHVNGTSVSSCVGGYSWVVNVHSGVTATHSGWITRHRATHLPQGPTASLRLCLAIAHARGS